MKPDLAVIDNLNSGVTMPRKASKKKATTKASTECHSVSEALALIDEREKATKDKLSTYQLNVEELTGHKPGVPLGPIDVVKIVSKVWGHKLND